MSHNKNNTTTERRMLASSQDYYFHYYNNSPCNNHLNLPNHLNIPSSTMDPTLKNNYNKTKPTSSTHQTTNTLYHNSNSKHFFMSNPLSKLNSIHKNFTQKPKNHQPFSSPPVYLDTHLQAKALAVSADFDCSTRPSITKPKHHQAKRIESRNDKDKVKKVSSDKGLVVVDKNKVQEFTVNDKKSNSKEVMKKDLIEGLDIKRMTISLCNSSSGGRRRSLGGSQVELADFLANNGAKIVSVDMPPFMQIHAVDCARKTHDSLEKFTSKTLALTLKKEFDGVYGPAWHCIVGTSFGSFVTHSVGGFLYFSMDQKLYVLLFKTTVQRAD